MLRKVHPGEHLPCSDLPEPYRLRCYAPGEEAVWLELLNACGEFATWTPQRLADEVLATLLPGGGLFVSHGDQLVGCASVCRMEQYQPYAMLMYVALLPEQRGRGLGQALLREILRLTQRDGFPGLLLHTESHRLAAVRSYLQMGFLPQLGPGAAGPRLWSEVLRRALLQGKE
jgi:mycothiol synthase